MAANARRSGNHGPTLLLASIATLLPGALAAADTTLVQGTVFVQAPILADGQIFAPVSQPILASWTSADRGAQPLLNTSHLSAYVDEWRWTSPVPAPHPTPGPGTVHARTRFELASAEVAVARAGPTNRLYYVGLEGGAELGLGHMKDCSFYAAQPRPRAVRAAGSLVHEVAILPTVDVVIPKPSTLRLDCRMSSLHLTLPPTEGYGLSLFDMDLVLSGRDAATGRLAVLPVASGHATTPNQTLDGLHDHVLRHISLRPADVKPIVLTSKARLVSVEAPLVQIVGLLDLPPFTGELVIGDASTNQSQMMTRLEGTFTATAGGRRYLTNAIEIAGARTMPHATAVPAESQLPAAVVALGVMAAAGLATLLWRGRSLLGAVVGLFSRLTPLRVLEHPRRRTIYDYVVENPGVRLHVAYKELEQNRTTFKHHVRTLIQHGLIRVQRRGRRLHLFPANAGPDQAALALTREPFVQRLLAILTREHTISQARIARELRVSQAYVSRIVTRLEEAGVVSWTRAGRGRRYLILQ